MKTAYSLFVGRLFGRLPLLLAHVGEVVGAHGGLVSHGRLVWHEHGRSPEHVAEGIVEEVQDGGGVQVSIPENKLL